MWKFLRAAASIARDRVRSRRDLVLENAFLRQQLAVLNRHVAQPRLDAIDRTILSALALVLPECRCDPPRLPRDRVAPLGAQARVRRPPLRRRGDPPRAWFRAEGMPDLYARPDGTGGDPKTAICVFDPLDATFDVQRELGRETAATTTTCGRRRAALDPEGSPAGPA